jgi:hypothetical protein
MRVEQALNMYTFENVAFHVLHRRYLYKRSNILANLTDIAEFLGTVFRR